MIAGWKIDTLATQALREARTGMPPAFGFGPERLAWESVFHDEIATDMANRLLVLPPGRRTALRRQIIDRVVPGLADVGRVGMAALFPDPAGQGRLLHELVQTKLPRN